MLSLKTEIKSELQESYSDYLDESPHIAYSEYLENVIFWMFKLLMCLTAAAVFLLVMVLV